MTMRAAMGGIGGGRRRQREVADIPEPKREDRSLDKLLAVRKQRLDRLERERREAREAWRSQRQDLREQKESWRDAVQAYKDFWEQSRQEFFSMNITSGQFRKAKAIYERMKKEAASMHAKCIEAVQHCKDGATSFFEARQRVLHANKQQEKLTILRDELKRATLQSEM